MSLYGQFVNSRRISATRQDSKSVAQYRNPTAVQLTPTVCNLARIATYTPVKFNFDSICNKTSRKEFSSSNKKKKKKDE